MNFSRVPKRFAVGLVGAFHPVQSERFALSTTRQKLRVCYFEKVTEGLLISGLLPPDNDANVKADNNTEDASDDCHSCRHKHVEALGF